MRVFEVKPPMKLMAKIATALVPVMSAKERSIPRGIVGEEACLKLHWIFAQVSFAFNFSERGRSYSHNFLWSIVVEA